MFRFFSAAVCVVIICQVSTAGGRPIDINNMSVYYGFGEMEIIKLDWSINNLHVTDLNGDGLNDIVVANNRKAKIELLVQRKNIFPSEKIVTVDPNDVDINEINPPTRFDRQEVHVSQKIGSLVCGDLNSDGLIDLAFYGEPKGLYVILQKAGESGGDKTKTLSWRTRKKIKIDDGLLSSTALVCADLTADGREDLILAGRDVVYVATGEKDGKLNEPVKYPATARTLAVKVADLNGDGLNDLILVTDDGERPVHVRFGLVTGNLGPQIKLRMDKPDRLKLYNYDGLGGDEILAVDAKSKRLNSYKFISSRGADQTRKKRSKRKRDTPKNAFGDTENEDWPVLFYPLESGQNDGKRDLVIGDFDGDRLVDIVISRPGSAELIFYRQLPELGLAEPVRFPAFADITSMSAADIDGAAQTRKNAFGDPDGDRKDELVVLSVKEKAIGISRFENGRLTFPRPIDLMYEPLAMDLADVDADGSIDCVYVLKDANDSRWLDIVYGVGRPPAKDVNSPRPVLELKTLEYNPEGLKVVDVDQDGLPDAIVLDRYEEPILIRQIEKGRFEMVESAKSQGSLIKQAKTSSIAIADVDGCAGAELLVAQRNFARSLVFADGRKWSVVDQYNARGVENNISAVQAFDIDDDAVPEILLLDGQKGQLQILKAGADKTYRFEKELDVGKWDIRKMLFAPLTGSANKSILLFDNDKFALITPAKEAEHSGSLVRQFSYETKIKDGRYGHLAMGDINSDGRADIITVEYKRNHFEILTFDSELKPIPAMRFKIFEQKGYRQQQQRAGRSSVEPRELTVADVTGDGKDDLAVIIHDRIIIYPQD